MWKYLQDAEQRHALEVNYFNDNTRCASEEPNLEDAEQTIQSSKGNQVSPKQTSIEDINVARNAPESLKSDTGHISRQHSKVPTDADEKCHKLQMQTKSVNKLRHQKMSNHIQTPNIMMGNIQMKKLPENLHQFI